MSSLRSEFNNAVAGLDTTVTTTVQSLGAKFQNIVGSVSASLSSLWDGGVVGINTNNAGELKNALQTYCSDIEAQIDSFNAAANLEIALKGQMQQAATDFVQAVKNLLEAYVSTMRQSIKDLDAVIEAYTNADQSISNQVQSNASEIRSQAQAMRMD